MSRDLAQSSNAVVSAPDCEMNASLPANAEVWAKLALSPMPGTSRPTQLGPRMRSRCGRAASSMACLKLGPPGMTAAERPALSTSAARVPRRPSSSMSPGTVGAGVQITARSGVCGRLATLRNAGRPATLPCFGLTGQIGPAKPPSSRLRISVAPRL